MIHVFQPSAADEEVAAIEAVFASNWLGPGERVKRFEQAFADYIGRAPDQLVTVSSATEGLFHLAAAFGFGPGDEVLLPSISFIGAAHAVRSTGAQVVLCDVDPLTLNPTVEHVERALTPRTKAILPLHYGGDPGDAAQIAACARQRSVALIEDAAISLGSFLDGRACGTWGDAGVWSFDSMKVLTTVDGGMVWCRDSDMTDRVRRSTRLGLGPSGFAHRFASDRWWEIDPPGVGRRGAMNDVAAAIGLTQLARLPGFLSRRAEIAAAYDERLRELPWVTALGRHGPDAARTFYWIQTSPGIRDRLAQHLLEREVYSTFKYWPLHKTRLYRSDAPFPGSDEAAARTLLLPLHQGLSDEHVDRVVEAVHDFAA